MNLMQTGDNLKNVRDQLFFSGISCVNKQCCIITNIALRDKKTIMKNFLRGRMICCCLLLDLLLLLEVLHLQGIFSQHITLLAMFSSLY